MTLTKLFSRIAICGTLAAAATFAAPINEVTVNLPHSVTVGSTTLPSGNYTISAITMSAGDQYFVVRGENMTPVIMPAIKADNDAAAAKTAVTIAQDGETWHFDKLSIAGETTTYEFGR